MYDDLYKELGLNHDLLPGARVSVYQYHYMLAPGLDAHTPM